MTNEDKRKMIPMSVIDALIKELEELIKYYQTTKELFFKDQTIFDLKNILSKVDKEIKKEATFVQSPIEQKIKDRIKYLDEGYPSDIKWSTANMIDELRKLLK